MDTLSANESEVAIPIDGAELQATMAVPQGARAVIVFAHGSGSGRASPRNRFVADRLVEAGFGVLLLDLLTLTEERIDNQTRDLRFDTDRLSARLVITIDWLAAGEQAGLPVAVFGASTGAAAALIAAAQRPERVFAVVSRGGRPDLAQGYLGQVQAPTLLIVGEQDTLVLELNADAAKAITAPVATEVVDGAGHLFEEPGALERVADLTVDWLGERVAERRRS